jgi:inositol-phosphate phosphatase/L-galactose 1-phosphate phosphatase/histidinol-phosphatase
MAARAAAAAASTTPAALVDDAMLELAHELADAAGRITTKYFRARGAFDVESKADASPVTIADREAEDAMRSLIAAAFPSHAVFGEERGLTRGVGSGGGGGDGSSSPSPRYMWVLDPIDGTKSFVTGA